MFKKIMVYFQMSKLQMSKYLGFTELDLKKILLGFPNVYTSKYM